MPNPTEQDARPLRVALVTMANSEDPSALSGMPYRMLQHLREAGLEVEPIYPEAVPTPVADWVARVSPRVRRRFMTWDGMLKRAECFAPDWTRKRTLALASHVAEQVRPRLVEGNFDAMVTCAVTWPLHGITGPDVPRLVHFTDATTRMVNTTYWDFMARSRGFKEACDEIEGGVLRSAARIACAADRIRESVENDYSVTGDHLSIVPMGANVTPDVPLDDIDRKRVPTRDNLKLCIVAGDPERKRLDFAVGVAERLRDRGWNCKLTAIGHPTERARASNVVKCLGMLNLRDTQQGRKHREVLANSHLFILPSLAEGGRDLSCGGGALRHARDRQRCRRAAYGREGWQDRPGHAA